MAVDLLVGLCGGAASVLVTYPFDTVKVRLQTQSRTNAKYKGIFHCFTSIIKQESVFGLYKGISSPLVGTAFINSITFGIFANFNSKFNTEVEKNVRLYFYSGAVSGFVQSFICSPMELAKLRLQLQGQGVRQKRIMFIYDPPLKYAGPVDCLMKVFREKGLRGIMRGLPATIIRDVPAFGLYFASYEWLIKLFAPDGPDDITISQQLVAGGVAGMISWCFYPIDVLKSRFQADDKYRNMFDCAQKSYRQEGMKVFSRGLGSTMLRAFAFNAVIFFTVDWTYRIADKYLFKKSPVYINNDDDEEYDPQLKKILSF